MKTNRKLSRKFNLINGKINTKPQAAGCDTYTNYTNTSRNAIIMCAKSGSRRAQRERAPTALSMQQLQLREGEKEKEREEREREQEQDRVPKQLGTLRSTRRNTLWRSSFVAVHPAGGLVWRAPQSDADAAAFTVNRI